MRKKLPADGQKLAVVYCRVSTKGQEDGTSLETQAEACIKHAEKLGYAVGRVTAEVFSGVKLWDRPLLAQDRADIKAGKFQALICYAIDRLSRDVAHLAIIMEECDRAECEPIFVTENLDNSAQGKLLRSVQSYVAEVEREKIRERVMRGRKAKLDKGKPSFVGDGLFGYRPDKEAEKFVVDELEAALVRRIYSMCLAGYGASAIAKRLNAEGIPSPKSKKSTWGGRSHWCQGTVYNILKNPAYKGDEWRWRTARVNGKDRKRPAEEWIKLPDGIRPPIVSPETWQAVQETFSTNNGAAKRNELRPVLLRAFAFCADCGRRMHLREHSRYGKGQDMYRCSSHNKLVETGCKGKNVPANELNEWVWSQVKSILNDPAIIERELKRLKRRGPDPQTTRSLESAKHQLSKVERGLRVLAGRIRESIENEDLWPIVQREIENASQEKRQIEARIEELKEQLAEQQNAVYDLRSLKEYCRTIKRQLDRFSFDDMRLAFRALGLAVVATGRDKSGWRLDISVPTRDVRTTRSAQESIVYAHPKSSESLSSNPSRFTA